MSKLKRLKPFYFASLITAGILIVLVLWPSSSALADVEVEVTPPDKTVVGVQKVTYIATVELESGDIPEEVTLQVTGRRSFDVDLPQTAGSEDLSADAGLRPGSLVVGTVFTNAEYHSGYGYFHTTDTTGSITYTIDYTPPVAGFYTLTVQAAGVEDVATLRVVPSATPTPTRIPTGEQVIIPPPEGGGAETVEPGARTRVTTPDENVVLDIPSVFADEPVQVVLTPIEPEEAPPPPAGREVLFAFSIDVYDLMGNETHIVSGVPVTLTVAYTDEDVERVGGDPSNLVIMRYVPNRGWVKLNTTVDTQRKLLIAKLTTFSVFAIGGKTMEGDINLDGVVNYIDLALLGTSYGTQQGDPLYKQATDFNWDGTVNYLDLAILAANYGTGR